MHPDVLTTQIHFFINSIFAAATVEIVATRRPCVADNLSRGDIRVDITGGTPPYSVSVNGGPFTTNTLYTDSNTGTIFVVVLDSAIPGQVVSSNFNLVPYPPPTTSLTATPSLIGKSTGTGAIFIRNLVGDGPFSFSLSGPTFSPVFDSYGNYYGALLNGPYTVTVTDTHGCSARYPITVPSARMFPFPMSLPQTLTSFLFHFSSVSGASSPVLLRKYRYWNHPRYRQQHEHRNASVYVLPHARS
jgi:hypothetical protein